MKEEPKRKKLRLATPREAITKGNRKATPRGETPREETTTGAAAHREGTATAAATLRPVEK